MFTETSNSFHTTSLAQLYADVEEMLFLIEFPVPLEKSHNLMCCLLYAWGAVTKYCGKILL